MDIMSLFDLKAMGMAGAFAMMVLQYLKDGLPEKSLKYVNLALSLAGAFLVFYKPGEIPNFDEIIKMLITGLGAAGGADTAFNFLSAKKSPAFTLPSKAPAPPKPAGETFTIETADPASFAEFIKSQKGIEAIREAVSSSIRAGGPLREDIKK